MFVFVDIYSPATAISERYVREFHAHRGVMVIQGQGRGFDMRVDGTAGVVDRDVARYILGAIASVIGDAHPGAVVFFGTAQQDRRSVLRRPRPRCQHLRRR